MKAEESCFKCAYGLHNFEGIRCKIYGYYFKDYVALKTSCEKHKAIKEKKKELEF